MKWSRTLLTLVLASTSTVVVAATDLNAGRTITDKDITITSMPVSTMTPDMPRKSSQVVGHTTKVPISKGQLIHLSEVK